MISELKVNGSATAASDYAGYAPIVVSGVTDRYPFTGGVRQSEAFTAIEDQGGKLTLVINGADIGDFQDEDTILVSGLTGAAAIFNGRHTCKGAGTDANDLLTDTDWVAVASAAGTVTRMNEALQARIYIAQSGGLSATIDTQVGSGGAFSVDISGAIKTLFQSIFSVVAGAVDAGQFGKEMGFYIDEAYLDTDYTTKTAGLIADPASPGPGDVTSFNAHASTDITNMLSGTELKTTQHQTRLKANTTIFYNALSNDADRIKFTPDTGSATIVTVSDYLGNIAASYTIPAGVKSVVVTAYDNATTTQRKDALTFIVPPTCTNKCLFWRNRLGGYGHMPVVRYEDKTVSQKIDRYTVDSWIERTYYGVIEPEGYGDYLQDLINSPEVKNEAGEQLYILDTQLQYRGEEIQPVVTAKIEIEWMN